MMSITGYNPHKYDISLSSKSEKKLKNTVKKIQTELTEKDIKN